MRRRVIGSTLVVVTMGSLLHFAWEWTGRNPMVAVFAATSESTWEHLKLAFWPALLLAPGQRWLYGKPPGWIVGTTVRCLLPSALIVAIFYGYTWLLGTNHLVLDIGTFVVAVFTGELAGHSVMPRHPPAGLRVASAAVVVVAAAAFSTLTFMSPDWFLFEEPRESRVAERVQRTVARGAPVERVGRPRRAHPQHARDSSHSVGRPGSAVPPAGR